MINREHIYNNKSIEHICNTLLSVEDKISSLENKNLFISATLEKNKDTNDWNLILLITDKKNNNAGKKDRSLKGKVEIYGGD